MMLFFQDTNDIRNIQDYLTISEQVESLQEYIMQDTAASQIISIEVKLTVF